MTTTEVATTLRSAELTELVALLRQQSDVRYDVVAGADRLSFRDGKLRVSDGAVTFTEDGVTDTEATLTPTVVFDGTLADRLGIPIKYLRRMRDADKLALLDANVNTWLANDPGRKYLVRGFLGSGHSTGIARSFLSDRFNAYDNLDLTLAVLDGAKKAGAALDVISADLSERKMRVRVACPEVAALAPVLLDGYRSPLDNATGRRAEMLARHGWLRPEDRPVVFAGFVFENSETGHGLWSLTPELVVQACTNGLTFRGDKFAKVHIGGRLDEGLIDWSDDTRRKNIELLTAQATDAVKQFVSAEFVAEKVAEIEAKAGVRVTDPDKTLKRVAQQFSFTKDEQDAILADFIFGGQMTSGGVLNAVTSVAQRVEDPDRAGDLSNVALDVLDFVAANA